MNYIQYAIMTLRAIVAGEFSLVTQVASFGKSKITKLFPFETKNGNAVPMLNVTLSSPSGTVNSVIGLGVYDEEEITNEFGEIVTRPARNLWADNGQCLENRTGIKFPDQDDHKGLALWCEAVSALYMLDGNTDILLKAGGDEQTIMGLKKFKRGLFCNTYKRIDAKSKAVSIGIEFPERDEIKAKQNEIKADVSLMDDALWNDEVDADEAEVEAKPVTKTKPRKARKAKAVSEETEEAPF